MAKIGLFYGSTTGNTLKVAELSRSLRRWMGLLYDKVKPAGERVVGMWPKDGYSYDASAAEVNGRLVGLALDEDSEPRSTPRRVEAWVQQLNKELHV